MNTAGRLEGLLATLFRYGSWLASAAIGLGFTLALIGSNSRTENLAILPNMRIATMGIVLFILLPVLRVLLMLLVFIRERDLRFACIAGLVLAIILLAIVLGLPARSHRKQCEIAHEITAEKQFFRKISTARTGRW